MMSIPLAKGAVWLLDFGVGLGHEQRGNRPGAILSADTFNQGPGGLVVVAPFTTRNRNNPLHHPVTPPEGGLQYPGYLRIDLVRTVSQQRLNRYLGSLSRETIDQVDELLLILLDL
jgi:mRNA interferase MazF